METSFDPNARLNRILQETSAETTRQHCRTREVISEAADEVKRVLSAHRADAYQHFYRMERDLADLADLLREQLAAKEARIAELETQLKEAQELLYRQHALLASPQAFETLRAECALSEGIAVAYAMPLSSEPASEDLEAEPVFLSPVRLSAPNGSTVNEKPRIKLPSFDPSISAIAQLVVSSAETPPAGGTPVGGSLEAELREPTEKFSAAEIAAGHAKLEAGTKRTTLKLPRLRLSR